MNSFIVGAIIESEPQRTGVQLSKVVNYNWINR